MKYRRVDQIDFIKTQIGVYQDKVNKEEDKNKKWILNDIVDMYYSVLETLESKNG